MELAASGPGHTTSSLTSDAVLTGCLLENHRDHLTGEADAGAEHGVAEPRAMTTE